MNVTMFNDLFITNAECNKYRMFKLCFILGLIYLLQNLYESSEINAYVINIKFSCGL